MALLMVNYALFGDPTLTLIGWIIAAIEASTAVLRLIKTIFRNNKKIVEKCDRAIAKHEKALTLLREKQAEYKKILEIESVKDMSLSDTTDGEGGAEISPPEDVGISNDDPEIEKNINDEIAYHERVDDYMEDPHTAPSSIIGDVILSSESADLLKKFYASVKKNEDV